MKKIYEAHEQVYRQMREKGIPSWDLRDKSTSIDPDDLRFLEDLLYQSWAPFEGQVIEFGCGTGPIVRWFSEKQYHVTGIDLSPTAIEMAKEQSEEYNCQYLVNDICNMDVTELGKYDLCIDGHFLHSIVDSEDRKNALINARSLLRPGGVFVLLSMCFPVDLDSFEEKNSQQILLDSKIYVPVSAESEYMEKRIIDGKEYVPIRYLGSCESLLAELSEAGFKPMLVRFNHCTDEEPVSSLNIAAIVE